MTLGTKAAGAAFLATAVAMVAPAKAEPWTIHIGYAPPPGHMQPIIEKLEKVHPELVIGREGLRARGEESEPDAPARMVEKQAPLRRGGWGGGTSPLRNPPLPRGAPALGGAVLQATAA